MNSIQTGDCTSQKKGKSYIRVVHYCVEKFYKHICAMQWSRQFRNIRNYKMLSSTCTLTFNHSTEQVEALHDIYGTNIIFRITRNIHKYIQTQCVSRYVMLKCNTVSGIYGENLLLSCLGKLIHELVGKGYIFTNLYIEGNYLEALRCINNKKCGYISI